jgi:hypothetical protein
MQSFESLQPQDFNLEGVIYTEKIGIYSICNGLVETSFYPSCTKLDQEFSLIANNYKLPKIKGVRTFY